MPVATDTHVVEMQFAVPDWRQRGCRLAGEGRPLAVRTSFTRAIPVRAWTRPVAVSRLSKPAMAKAT